MLYFSILNIPFVFYTFYFSAENIYLFIHFKCFFLNLIDINIIAILKTLIISTSGFSQCLHLLTVFSLENWSYSPGSWYVQFRSCLRHFDCNIVQTLGLRFLVFWRMLMLLFYQAIILLDVVHKFCLALNGWQFKSQFKIWNSHTMEYFSSLKKNKILIYVTIWMDFKTIMLCEIRQMQKTTYCMIPFI